MALHKTNDIIIITIIIMFINHGLSTQKLIAAAAAACCFSLPPQLDRSLVLRCHRLLALANETGLVVSEEEPVKHVGSTQRAGVMCKLGA